MSDDNRTRAIIGDLSMQMRDGTVLADRTDIGLAWKWAEHEHNARGLNWSAMSYGEQCASVAEALAELRRSYGERQG